MRTAIIVTALGLSIGLAACDAEVSASVGDGEARRERAERSGRPIQVSERLECPERQGSLDRLSVAADGRACAYRDKGGGEVQLTLTPLNGRPAADVLAGLEPEMRSLVPPPLPRAQRVASRGGAEKASVRLPGLSIEAEGENARVRLPGVSIDADNGSATVNMSGGDGAQVTVNAVHDHAEIRTRKNETGGVRQSYIISRETPAASGWRAVAYEAAGPTAGPLVVATVRTRVGDGSFDEAFEEARDLIDRNVRD